MTDHLQLLDDLLVQADETMALIQQDVECTVPPADHPMWASMARQKSAPMETPANSILRPPATTQAPVVECQCRVDDLVPALRQEPRIDLVAGVVKCVTCGNPIGKSCRNRRVRWMRGIVELHQQHPMHVDVAELQKQGVICAT